MIGYQADIGPGYWGALYEESRRNKVLMKPDSVLLAKLVKVNDRNEMEIRCENCRIRLCLNGKQTVAYTEPDQTLPQSGLIALQFNGGGKVRVFYKELLLTELP